MRSQLPETPCFTSPAPALNPWRPCSRDKQIPYTHSTEPIHTHIHTTHPLHVQTTHTPFTHPLYITQTLHVNGWERARRNHGQFGRVLVTEWSREGGISAGQVPTPSWLLGNCGCDTPSCQEWTLQELLVSLGIPCPQVLRNEDGTKASLATEKRHVPG